MDQRKGRQRASDAVTVVREVMNRRMSGQVFFDDELDGVQPELKILEQRELKVKSLGGMYARVEMSSYVRDMLHEVVTHAPVQSA